MTIRRVYPHRGVILKVIPLKLFLDMVPSAFADNVVTVRCVRVFVEADEHAFKAAWVVHVSKIRVTSISNTGCELKIY